MGFEQQLKVYYNYKNQDLLAGHLREDPAGGYVFEYDGAYLDQQGPSIAHTLPASKLRHHSLGGLHTFFSNLASEGVLRRRQSQLLGLREASDFELLSAFGFDCHGAVYMVSEEQRALASPQPEDPQQMAVQASRASLSGVQPKLAVRCDEEKKFVPCAANELSTHIAKLASPQLPELIENEFLTTLAFMCLNPKAPSAYVSIGSVLDLPALMVQRFDRQQGQRIHFEEFTQLLGLRPEQKYDASHKQISDFIYNTPSCVPADVYDLFQRIITSLIVGNTDMHLKNWALVYTNEGLRLSPPYDCVYAASYGYQTVALKIDNNNLNVTTLKPQHLKTLLKELQLTEKVWPMVLDDIKKLLPLAQEKVRAHSVGDVKFKKKLCHFMEARWNQFTGLIGNNL